MKAKTIYRYVIAAVFAIACTGVSAQLKTSYFMEGSVPRYDMNAALTPQNSYLTVLFGNTGIGLNNDFLTVDNFFYPIEGRTALFLHPSVSTKKFLNKLPANPRFGFDMNYNLVGFGRYNRKNDYFWSFGFNVRAEGNVGIPKELFRVLKGFRNGNYDLGKLSADAMVYTEMAFGFAMPVGWENLVVGGRLKLLTGGAHFETKTTSIPTEVTNERAYAEVIGTVRASVFGNDYRNTGNNGEKMDLIESVFSYDKLLWNQSFKSWGGAIDLGAEMKLFDERLKVSMAINDLGFIRWGAANSIQGDITDMLFEYKGYNTEKDEIDWTRPEGLYMNKTGNKAYTTRLSTTMNVGAEWNFFEDLLGVGVLSHTKFGRNYTYSEVTVTGTVRPADWFTAAISHSFTNNKFGIFGLALNFHPRGFNFFVGADYIPLRLAQLNFVSQGFKWPVHAKSLNVYAGISFGIGGRSKPW
jgi:hypothetical protein